MELCRCLNQLTAQGCRTANCSFSHSQQDPFSYSGSSDSGREKRGRKSKRPKRDWEQEDLPAQKRARHISGGIWGHLGDYSRSAQEWRSEVWNSTGLEVPYCWGWDEMNGGPNNTGYSGRNDTGYSDSGTWDTSSFWSRDRSAWLGEDSYSEELQDFSFIQLQNCLLKKDQEIEKLSEVKMTLLHQHDGSMEKNFDEVKQKPVTATQVQNSLLNKDQEIKKLLKQKMTLLHQYDGSTKMQNMLLNKDQELEKLKKEKITFYPQPHGSMGKKFEEVKKKQVTASEIQNSLLNNDQVIEKLKKDKMTLLHQYDESMKKKFEEVKKKLLTGREMNESNIKQDFSCFLYKYAKQINDAEKSDLKRRLENLIKQSEEDKFIIEDLEKNACSQSKQIFVLRSKLTNPPEKEKEPILVFSPEGSPFPEGNNFRYLTSSPLQHRASAIVETPKLNVPSSNGSILHMSHTSKSSQLFNSSTFRSQEVDSPVYIFSSPHRLDPGQMQ